MTTATASRIAHGDASMPESSGEMGAERAAMPSMREDERRESDGQADAGSASGEPLAAAESVVYEHTFVLGQLIVESLARGIVEPELQNAAISSLRVGGEPLAVTTARWREEREAERSANSIATSSQCQLEFGSLGDDDEGIEQKDQV